MSASGSASSPVLVLHVMQLVFPPGLTPRQRAALHELGQAHGLCHASSGEGTQRHIQLGAAQGKQVLVADLLKRNGQPTDCLTDEQLIQLINKCLNIDASNAFSAVSGKGSTAPTQRTRGSQSVPSTTPASQPDVETWVHDMLLLVDMERQAEVDQATEATAMCSAETAQARGRALLNLRMSDMEGGLLGRTLLTLVSNKGYTGSGPAPELPPHKFSTHDVVALHLAKGPASGEPLCSGIVYRVKENCIIVAVDEAPEEGLDQPLRVDKLANEVTYKRLKTTLSTLGRVANGGSITGSGQQPTPGSVLVDVAFGKREPRFDDSAALQWTPVNTRLDDSQRAAITHALQAKDFALIHGPPGTGKTTAVVEYILQEVSRGSRVLAASASNIAVDNLVERLTAAAPKIKTLRMGHPARLLPQVLDSCLEAHLLKSDNSSLAKDCRKEIKNLNAQLLKLGPRDRNERRQIRADLRRLAKEERSRQEAAIVEVVKGAQVVASTLTGLLHHHLEGQVFDVVVIDEAAQALEPACWSACLRAPRAVLAGDHLQLPPTVISEHAAALGLGRTLFERLQGLYGEHVSSMLTVQYRMNSAIMTWSSNALYEGKLTAHESVAEHTLKELVLQPPLPASSSIAGSLAAKRAAKQAAAAAAATAQQVADGGLLAASIPVLLLIDTAGCGFEEHQEAEGDSKANEGEAKAVMSHVHRLVKAGVQPSGIGIITPYNAQVALLRELRPEKLHAVEISSVDGFQGREKEAIVISMVRSNEQGEVGFLADQRRMNVAVTRGRRHVCLVADSETVGRDPFLRGLLDHFEAHGEYCSAQELVDAAQAGP